MKRSVATRTLVAGGSAKSGTAAITSIQLSRVILLVLMGPLLDSEMRERS